MPRRVTRRRLIQAAATASATASLAVPPHRVTAAETAEPTRPAATDLTPTPADVPWDRPLVELNLDPEKSTLVTELREQIPRLCDADTAGTTIDSPDNDVATWPPDINAVAVVTDGPAPATATVDSLIDDHVSKQYTEDLALCFDPELTVQHTRGSKHWVYTLSVREATLRDVYTRHRVADTLFVTNVRAYDSQHDAVETATHLTQTLTHRRQKYF